MLISYYDLSKNPASYDVVTFLLQAERERIRLGRDDLAIEILPGPNGGFRQDGLWPSDVETRLDLLRKVVVPMCSLLPSVRRVTVRHDRPRPEPDSFGCMARTIDFSRFVEAMRAGVRPLRPLGETKRRSRLITMTLRECVHHPLRNSNVEQWRKAAQTLGRWGYDVVIVRDTRFAAEPLEGCETDAVAAGDLHERVKLYASAACNMFVSNGPGWMAFALDVPVLMLRPFTEGGGFLYSRAGLEKFGIATCEQMPGAPPYQRIAWFGDIHDAIVLSAMEFIEDNETGQRKTAAGLRRDLAENVGA